MLKTEFTDLEMNKTRCSQWYDFMMDMSDSEYKKKIDVCLQTCKHTPVMADVLGYKQEDVNRPNAGAYEYFDT